MVKNTVLATIYAKVGEAEFVVAIAGVLEELAWDDEEKGSLLG